MELSSEPVCFQLRVSTELHTARPVGNRLRHFRRTDSADNPTEQVTGPGTAWWPAWRLVSSSCFYLSILRI